MSNPIKESINESIEDQINNLLNPEFERTFPKKFDDSFEKYAKHLRPVTIFTYWGEKGEGVVDEYSFVDIKPYRYHIYHGVCGGEKDVPMYRVRRHLEIEDGAFPLFTVLSVPNIIYDLSNYGNGEILYVVVCEDNNIRIVYKENVVVIETGDVKDFGAIVYVESTDNFSIFCDGQFTSLTSKNPATYGEIYDIISPVKCLYGKQVIKGKTNIKKKHRENARKRRYRYSTRKNSSKSSKSSRPSISTIGDYFKV